LYASGNTIIEGIFGARVPINVFAGNWRYRFNTAKDFKKKFQKILSEWRFTENPENIFCVREISGKNFFGKIRTRTHPQTRIIPNHSKTRLNPPKSKFSDVIAITGSQGHLQPVSPEKPTVINAKKRCRQKPAKLHGFIRFKMDILAK